MSSEHIPVYSINKFQREDHRKKFQIEVFDKNRNFKVTYPHRHDFYEILFITQGTGSHTIDFQKYEIKPNSIFFLSPGQIHNLELSDDILGFIFLFTSEFYLINKQDKNKLLELPFFYSISNENPPLLLSSGNDTKLLSDLFSQACQENGSLKEDSEELIGSLLDIILIQCKRLYPVTSANQTRGKGKLLVKRFKLLLEEKYQENIPVKNYAALLSVTPNHLNETIKSLTGRTATDMISEKMILEIKRLLLHTELTVSEIAFQLNFSDQSYFSRYFRNKVGISPLEFRKSH